MKWKQWDKITKLISSLIYNKTSAKSKPSLILLSPYILLNHNYTTINIFITCTSLIKLEGSHKYLGVINSWIDESRRIDEHRKRIEILDET